MLGDCAISQFEPYWKDKSLYDLEFTTNCPGVNIADIVFKLINTLPLISRSWQIIMPSCLSDKDEDYELSGVSDRDMIAKGVRWASFNMY